MWVRFVKAHQAEYFCLLFWIISLLTLQNSFQAEIEILLRLDMV
jgi:hypothetical protein